MHRFQCMDAQFIVQIDSKYCDGRFQAQMGTKFQLYPSVATYSIGLLPDLIFLNGFLTGYPGWGNHKRLVAGYLVTI